MKVAILLQHAILLNSFTANIDLLLDHKHEVRIFIHPHDWYANAMDSIHKFNPDVIWTWNGRFSWYENVFYDLQKEGYRIVVSELAWLPQKPNHYICDFEDNFHKCLQEVSPTYPINEELIERTKKLYGIERRESDHILVPFQLEIDTSISHLSPVVKTNLETVERAKKLFPHKQIIATKHPKEINPYNPDLLPHIYEGTDTTLQLAIDAEYVVAINSTVTMETLLWHGNVIIFGRNPAWQASIDGNKGLIKPVDIQLRYRVLSYLLDRQYNWEHRNGKVVQYIEGDKDVY